jgi:DNA repair protein RadA/Sms
VPGSIVLVGGDPGIGKSTLMLQMAMEMAKVQRVLYVSGEESERQIKMRAVRLLNGTQGTAEESFAGDGDESRSDPEPRPRIKT